MDYVIYCHIQPWGSHMTGLIGKAYRCCFQNGCFQQIWKLMFLVAPFWAKSSHKTNSIALNFMILEFHVALVMFDCMALWSITRTCWWCSLQLGCCGYVVVDGYCHKLCPVEGMPPLARKAEQWISTHTITTPLHTSIYCYLVASCALAWCIPWDWIWEVRWLAATMFGGNPRRCQNY